MNTHVTRILAVDDDADMRMIYQESINLIPITHQENTRFVVTLAKDGNEAVEAVKDSLHTKEPFAVVFLDLKMPPLPNGGVWAAKKIRELDSALNIILVTGAVDVDPLDLSHRIRPLDKLLYLQKPCSISEIQQCALSLGAKWHTEALLIETNEELYLTNRQLLDTNTSLSILARNLDKTRKETEKQLLDRLRAILRPF
ncbi:MAG TPA: response regulator, partial [Thermodesulfobacteriota bacterium]|nr:response regulator [Thermodesulfobacteriota bacterium]